MKNPYSDVKSVLVDDSDMTTLGEEVGTQQHALRLVAVGPGAGTRGLGEPGVGGSRLRAHGSRQGADEASSESLL